MTRERPEAGDSGNGVLLSRVLCPGFLIRPPQGGTESKKIKSEYTLSATALPAIPPVCGKLSFYHLFLDLPSYADDR